MEKGVLEGKSLVIARVMKSDQLLRSIKTAFADLEKYPAFAAENHSRVWVSPPVSVIARVYEHGNPVFRNLRKVAYVG